MSSHSDATGLRIAVTGHRYFEGCDDVALAAAVRTALDRLLRAWGAIDRGTGRDRAPAPELGVRVITGLAQGTDVIAAEQALHREVPVRTVLPRPLEEYVAGYDDDPVCCGVPATKWAERARAVTGDAAARTYVLDADRIDFDGEDGPRAPRWRQHAATGRVLLAQSDVLLAVVDDSGRALFGNADRDAERGPVLHAPGSTRALVGEARERGIPILLVDLAAPSTPRYWLSSVGEPTAAAEDDALQKMLADFVWPPEPRAAKDKGEHPNLDRVRDYLDPRLHWKWRWLLQRVGILLFSLLIDRKVAKDRRGQDLRKKLTKDARAATQQRRIWDRQGRKGEHGEEAVDGTLAAERVRANARARLVLDLYRGSFTALYLLGMLAVVFGLLYAFTQLGAFVIAEIACLLLALLVYLCATRQRWKERGVTYRVLAERLRLAMALQMVGGEVPAGRVPRHDPYGTPQFAWPAWLTRTIVRRLAFGASDAPLRYSDLRAGVGLDLFDWINGQVYYHRKVKKNHRRAKRIVGWFLTAGFAIAFAAAIAHLFVDATLPSKVLSFLTIGLPAAMAALHGFGVQAEMERLALRSAKMESVLVEYRERLFAELTESPPAEGPPAGMSTHAADLLVARRHPPGTPEWTRVNALAVEAAELMLAETFDWRGIYLAHGLPLH